MAKNVQRADICTWWAFTTSQLLLNLVDILLLLSNFDLTVIAGSQSRTRASSFPLLEELKAFSENFVLKLNRPERRYSLSVCLTVMAHHVCPHSSPYSWDHKAFYTDCGIMYDMCVWPPACHGLTASLLWLQVNGPLCHWVEKRWKWLPSVHCCTAGRTECPAQARYEKGPLWLGGDVLKDFTGQYLSDNAILVVLASEVRW